MTRVFLPNQYDSYQIAKELSIEYFIPQTTTHPTKILAQKRVCDYIIDINKQGFKYSVSTAKNGLIKQFDSQQNLIDYLNNS